jgi:hypothetical protein
LRGPSVLEIFEKTSNPFDPRRIIGVKFLFAQASQLQPQQVALLAVSRSKFSATIVLTTNVALLLWSLIVTILDLLHKGKDGDPDDASHHSGVNWKSTDWSLVFLF